MGRRFARRRPLTRVDQRLEPLDADLVQHRGVFDASHSSTNENALPFGRARTLIATTEQICGQATNLQLGAG